MATALPTRSSFVLIVMARSDSGGKMAATMFLVDLPDPAIRVERVLDTIDSSMPGGHAIIVIDGLRVSADQILGEVHEGFRYAQRSEGQKSELQSLMRISYSVVCCEKKKEK